MDDKNAFVTEIANYYKIKRESCYRNYFQGGWFIPENRLPKILGMAQTWISEQNKRHEKILNKTLINDLDVIGHKEIKK